MTSSNGINWTARSSAADYSWRRVTYANGLFVAVAQTGTGDRVMTSSDGITWTTMNSAADNDWIGLTYGNGRFVAVSNTGTGNRVMTMLYPAPAPTPISNTGLLTITGMLILAGWWTMEQRQRA